MPTASRHRCAARRSLFQLHPDPYATRVAPSDQPAGVQGDDPRGFHDRRLSGNPVGSFPGTQNLIRNMPPGGIQAPENVGLGSKLTGEHQALPELSQLTTSIRTSRSSAKCGSTLVRRRSGRHAKGVDRDGHRGAVPGHPAALAEGADDDRDRHGEGRIINLFGHRHAATDRFAVWKNDDLVYDSWNWQESVAFDYDSITKNPPLDEAGRKTARFGSPPCLRRRPRSGSSVTSTIRRTTR